MNSDDPLMMGMFWAGLLVASVPMTLAIGIGIYVLKRYLRERQGETAAGHVSDGSLRLRDDPSNR